MEMREEGLSRAVKGVRHTDSLLCREHMCTELLGQEELWDIS